MTAMKPSMFIPTADNVVIQLWDNIASMMGLELMCFLFAMMGYAVLFKSRGKEGQGKLISSKVCFAEPIDAGGEVECFDQPDELGAEVLQEAEVSVTAAAEADLESREFDKALEEVPQSEELEEVPQSEVAIYNSTLEGFVQGELYNDGLRLLDEMSKKGAQPNDLTRSISVKLLSRARKLDKQIELLQRIETTLRADISQPQIAEKCLPRLAVVVARATGVQNRCINEIAMTGNLPQVKAVCRTLKKHGFVKKCDDGKFPLNGHWETEHGLNVIIEGKIVRWSQKRASKLKFVGAARSSCLLSLYGETTVGHIVAPTATCASKTLQWDNGDVWHSLGGCSIAHSVVYSSQMTNVLRDATQDEAARKQTHGRLQLLCKDGLNLLPNCLDQVMGYIGNDSYYVRVHFESKDGPPWSTFFGLDDDSFLGLISRRHPQVGFRHCWADESSDLCGQRTLMQGQDLPEDEFCRLVNDCKSTTRR